MRNVVKIIALFLLCLLITSGGAMGARAGNVSTNSEKELRLFLNSDFREIRSGRLIPRSILEAVGPFAEPGEAFQKTDSIRNPRLLFQRLVFAGLNSRQAFVVFERGGRGYSINFALLRIDRNQPVVTGKITLPRVIKGLDALKRQVMEKRHRRSIAF